MNSFKLLQQAKFIKSPKFLSLTPGLAGESKMTSMQYICSLYLLRHNKKLMFNAVISLFPNERKCCMPRTLVVSLRWWTKSLYAKFCLKNRGNWQQLPFQNVNKKLSNISCRLEQLWTIWFIYWVSGWTQIHASNLWSTGWCGSSWLPWKHRSWYFDDSLQLLIEEQ